MKVDGRLAWRTLWRRKWATLWFVSIAGLGLGAMTTVFALVDALLIRPLPFDRADRLATIQSRQDLQRLGASHADSREWSRAASLDGLALYEGQHHAVVGFADHATSLPTARVDSAVFELLGVPVERGRWLGPDEDQPGSAPAVVLGHRLWRDRLGGDPQVLGSSLPIDGIGHQVIGVAPPGFDFPAGCELWITRSAWADQWPHRSIRVAVGLTRLAPGVSWQHARQELDALAARQAERYPDSNRGLSVSLAPLREQWIAGSRVRLLALFGACGFLLSIAVANLLGLLAGWSLDRERELRLRRALGAPMGHLIRQPICEAMLLAGLAVVAGWSLTTFGLRWVETLLPAGLPEWSRPVMDARSVLFLLALSVALGALFSLVPSIQAWRVERFLNLGSRGDLVSNRGLRLRRGLVVGQLAIGLLLLIGAGLFSRSLERLATVDTGFGRGFLTFQLDLPVRALESYDQVRDTYDRVLEAIGELPDVEHVGATTAMPLARRGAWDQWELTLEGQSDEAQRANPRAYGQGVSSDYFAAMDIPMLHGRAFRRDATDAREVIVSRRLAERLWGDPAIAVGERLRLGPPSAGSPSLDVIGVVADVRTERLDHAPARSLYLPLHRLVSWPLYGAIATRGGTASTADALRQTVADAAPEIAVREVVPIERHVAAALWRERTWASLAELLSGFALLLTLVGVYGVMATLVARRRVEVGIRMALGATRSAIARSILGDTLRLVATGLIVGLPLAAAAAILLSAKIDGTGTPDLAIWLRATAVIAAGGLIAGSLPLARALRVYPARILRDG